MKRPRFTVRRLALLIALIAIGLMLYHELNEGLPPRSVIHGIPARIARLKPGMTRQETMEILGIGKPWYWGGIGPGIGIGSSPGGENHEFWFMGVKGSFSGEGWSSTQSRCVIGLTFPQDQGGEFSAGQHEATRLISATFSLDDRLIAEMPRATP